MKPLVACYKAYRGGEWLNASLESISKQCAGAVIALSDQPWKGAIPLADGSYPPENCTEPLTKFRQRHPEFKIVTVRTPANTHSNQQYRLGMECIAKSFGKDCGVLIVDTDEVWNEADLLTLRQTMSNNHNALCFRSAIWTYLRSPLWRVTPQESARVVVGLANPDLPTGKSRMADVYSLYPRNKIVDVPCNFHHFGYVRLDPEEITSKLANSTTQDQVPTRPQWKEIVWDTLPEGTNLHPQVGFEKCWGGVTEINIDDLPQSVPSEDVFWSGLMWHNPSALCSLLLCNDTVWRSEVETLPPQDCPATTVKPSLLPALIRLSALLGQSLTSDSISFLPSRLRMSFRETAQLAFLTTEVPMGGRLLEIGSGHGGSMATMMLGCLRGTMLTGVDPYLPYTEENVILDRGVQEGSAGRFFETIAFMKKIVGSRNVELICKPSAEAAKDHPPDSLDLLLVDGNHSYASCLEDLRLWWPTLKKDGLLLVHDYASRFPGVIRAVKEFEAEQKIRFHLPTRSTLLWGRKL